MAGMALGARSCRSQLASRLTAPGQYLPKIGQSGLRPSRSFSTLYGLLVS